MAHYVTLRGKSRNKKKVDSTQHVSFTSEAIVNLDDAATKRLLDTKHGDVYSVPNFDFQITQQGTAAVAGTASGLVFRAPKDLIVKGVYVTTAIAPATNSIIVDVKKTSGTAVGVTAAAGTSIFAGTANRPSIGTAQFSGSSVGTAAFGAGTTYIAWNAGEYLRVELPQVGSAPTGNRVTVYLDTQLPTV